MSDPIGSVPLGAGLVLAGGGALYLSPTLPAETKQAVQIGGVVAIAVGAWMVYTNVKASGGVLKGAADFVFGGETTFDEPGSMKVYPSIGVPADRSTAPTPADQDRSFVIPSGGRVVSPLRDGSVNPGIWSGSYEMIVELFNETSSPITGEIRVEVDETYRFGSDESAVGVSDPITVAPHSRVTKRLNVPIGGGKVRYSEANAIARVAFNGKSIDTLQYTIGT